MNTRFCAAFMGRGSSVVPNCRSSARKQHKFYFFGRVYKGEQRFQMNTLLWAHSWILSLYARLPARFPEPSNKPVVTQSCILDMWTTLGSWFDWHCRITVISRKKNDIFVRQLTWSSINSWNKISILPCMVPINNMLFPMTKLFFFWFCHCYCSRMPQAWESAHFIIQWLPLLNFCFLQCPLPLKAKDCLNTFPPTGRAAHTVSPEAMVHNTLCICLLQNCWHLLLQTKGVISMTSSLEAVHKAKVLQFLAKLQFLYVSARGCMIIILHYLPV